MCTKMALYNKRPTNNSINWNSSVFSQFYCVDENYVEEYTEKVVDAQNHQLDSLKQDLAAWINKIIGIHYLSGENLLQELDNGAIICHLALAITRRAKLAIVAGYKIKALPKMREKYFENAMRGSFFSRDNVANFIIFCQSIGVHQNLLFESDDLVLHTNSRNVILCLLEVARLSSRYGIEPPNLIQFEKEITEEEKLIGYDFQTDSQISWQFQSLPPRFDCNNSSRNSPAIIEQEFKKWTLNELVPYKSISNVDDQCCQSLPSSVNKHEVDICSKNYTFVDTKMSNDSDKAFDELDKRIEKAAEQLHLNCKCANRRLVKLKIRKIGEGKYSIAGRNVFVRLLKDRHMMVRVGGGWDTLDHFLQRHDPCQVDGKEYKPFVVRRPTTIPVVPNISKRYSYYSSFKKILRPGESAI